MKASLAVALSGAVLAAASPLAKRVLTTSVVTEIVFTTVYEGEETASAKPAVFFAGVHTTSTESTTEPPPPPPTSTSAPPPPPPPPTTTSVAPAPVVQTVAPVVVAAPKVQVDGDYVSVMLNQHNIHRFNHSSGALSWHDGLASAAETLAKSCSWGHNTAIPAGIKYGQNLAMAGGTNAGSASKSKEGAKAVTNQWYNGELNQYPGYGGEPSMGNFGAWGHFSAVVWSGTTSVGCCTALCPGMMGGMDSWYTVCNYGPSGNVAGNYGSNVKRPQGQANVVV